MPPFVTFYQGQQQDTNKPPLTATHRSTTLMVSSKVAPLPHDREYHGGKEIPPTHPKGTSAFLLPRKTQTHPSPVMRKKNGTPLGSSRSYVVQEEMEGETKVSSEGFVRPERPATTTLPLPPSPPPPGIPQAPGTRTATSLATNKRLVRHQSEPVGGASQSSSNACRRAIFDRYWKHEEEETNDDVSSSSRRNMPTSHRRHHDSPPVLPQPRAMRRRSTSAPADFASSFWDWSLGGYSTPAHSAFIRHREHFSACRILDAATVIAPAFRASHDDEEDSDDVSTASGTAAAVAASSTSGGRSSSSNRTLPPALPPLPVPLQRFHNDGRGSSMAGMYPLVRAQSILRQSSYHVETSSRIRADSDAGTLPEFDDTFAFPGMGDGLNLTRSVSRLVTLKSTDVKALSEAEGVEEDLVTDATASSTSISSAASNAANGTNNNTIRRGVSFDPRITVTEFEDANPRIWFTDTELERFRMETVLVAQKYLIKHPELIDLYNKPTLDPVTGTMRKRALFSMPALRAGDASSVSSGSTGKSSFLDDNDDKPTSTEPLHHHRKNMTELAFRNVKSILVADRNKIILDLFRKSLRTLFPHARIVTVQSGDEAWRHFEAAASESPRRHGPYDIVIAEERLDQPLTVTGTPLVTGGKRSLSSCVSPSGSSRTELASDVDGAAGTVSSSSSGTVRFKLTGPHHVRHDSLLTLPSQRQGKVPMGCSGSELLRKISASYGSGTASASQTPLSNPKDDTSVNHHHHHQGPSSPCLLIGVSVQPDHERDTFVAAGADLVWGKPPPRMDEQLRDELVALLLQKRGRRNHASNGA